MFHPLANMGGLSDAELAAKMQADEEAIAAEDEEEAVAGIRRGVDEYDDDDLADIIQQIQAAELQDRFEQGHGRS